MPIYEYECMQCGAEFDMRQSVGDPPPATCPRGHRAVRRRLSVPTVIFKGSGFYVTDHGRNGRSPTSGTTGRRGSEKKDSGTKEESSAAQDSSKEES